MFDVLRPPSWRSLSRGALTSFGLRVAGAGLLYGLHVLLARWMGTEGYGVYAFAISWTSFLAEFGTLGLPNAALRFVPEYLTERRVALLHGFLRSGRGLVLGTSALLAALASVVALVLPAGDLPLAALLAGFGLAPLMALTLFETEVLRACNRFALSYAPIHVLRPLGTGLGAGGVLWLTGHLSPLQVLLCIGVVLGGVLLFQQGGTQAVLPDVHAAIPTRRTRRWVRVALPLLFTSGSQMVLRKTDIFLLGALVGPDEVGVYFAAMRTAQVITLFSFAADAVAAPLVSRLHHDDESDEDALQQAVSSLAHWYFWPTLAGALGLSLLAEPVLSLFGAAFTSGWPVTYAFMAGLVVNAATGPQQHLLTLTGHEQSCAYIYGWCAALNVGLNLLGIHYYGALGAALATATALVVRTLWIRHRVVELTGVTPSILSSFRTAPTRT